MINCYACACINVLPPSGLAHLLIKNSWIKILPHHRAFDSNQMPQHGAFDTKSQIYVFHMTWGLQYIDIKLCLSNKGLVLNVCYLYFTFLHITYCDILFRLAILHALERLTSNRMQTLHNPWNERLGFVIASRQQIIPVVDTSEHTCAIPYTYWEKSSKTLPFRNSNWCAL